MAEYFDPSPRASKRRKTATYKSGRSVLEDKENDSLGHDDQKRLLRGDKQTSEGSDIVVNVGEDHETSSQRSEPGLETTMYDGQIVNDSESQDGNADGEVKESGHQHQAHEAGIEGDDDTITVQPRSSGRERRKPRRYSLSPEPKPAKSSVASRSGKEREKPVSGRKTASAVENLPKGILTPSRKHKRIGPRKSVVFDQSEKEIEEQLGFKDITTSTSKPNKAKPLSKIITSDENEEISLTPVKKATQHRSTPSISTPQPDEDLQIDFDDMIVDVDHDIVVEPVIIEQDQPGLQDLNFEDSPAILEIKNLVLSRLVSRAPKQVPPHLQPQYETLHSLLRATVTTGESNSLLLLGARGTGKSHLLDAALTDLHSKHANDFHAIHLNGFYQTDDRLALREIWRQLGREMQVEEMESGEVGGSYADTMSSLLSLLSHPDEFDETTAMNDPADDDTSAVRTSKSIVFILDEFDLFTTHPRQTLLYNLFDIAQSKKAPIAVIGCSTRMDVVECLEKRVKSRFSHRWLHIPSVKTLSEFEELGRTILCVEEEDRVAAMKITERDLEARRKWNEYIQTHFLPSAQIQDLIKCVYYTTKSSCELFAQLYVPIATTQLSAAKSTGSTNGCLETNLTSNPPTLLSLLPDLSTLHLALLVAASRLDTIHNLTTLNFNLVYAHYAELLSRSKLQVTASGAVAVGASLRQWSRDTAKSAWEDLGLYEYIVPVSGAGLVAGSKDGGSAIGDHLGGEGASVRMWRIDVTLEELDFAVKEKWLDRGGARDVLSKWCKEI